VIEGMRAAPAMTRQNGLSDGQDYAGVRVENRFS